MSVTHVVGIDPGLVHTGIVGLQFNDLDRTLTVYHQVVPGVDVKQVKGWIMTDWQVFIEAYRPRQRLDADVRMVQAEADLRRALPSAKFLTNMGIKKVVTQELMESLDLWKWSTPTHHQDLRSAARIALLGMMKSDVLNHVLSEMVREQLDFQTWTIQHG